MQTDATSPATSVLAAVPKRDELESVLRELQQMGEQQEQIYRKWVDCAATGAVPANAKLAGAGATRAAGGTAGEVAHGITSVTSRQVATAFLASPAGASLQRAQPVAPPAQRVLGAELERSIWDAKRQYERALELSGSPDPCAQPTRVPQIPVWRSVALPSLTGGS